MFYYMYNSVTMYCTYCAIYTTAALTQGWQMIGECDFLLYGGNWRCSSVWRCVRGRHRTPLVLKEISGKLIIFLLYFSSCGLIL